MDRRQFCRSSIIAGLAGAYPLITACSKPSPPTEADTSIAAISLDGDEIELEEAAIRELGDSMNGSLMLSGHPQYDTARMLWNGMHDKRPALIAQCAGASDVSNAVTFARERACSLRFAAEATAGRASQCARVAS